MSAPVQEARAHAGGQRRRVLAVVVALAASAGLAAAAIWLLAGNREAPGTQGAVVTAPARATAGETGFAAPAPAGRDSESAAALSEKTVEVTPLEPPAAAATEATRAIRGVAVRVSDGSPVASALVFAVRRQGAGTSETDLARALTGEDGTFTLTVPQPADTFRVLLTPERGRPGRDVGQLTAVPVSVQWADNDPTADEVRLKLDTGWRLDVHLLDSAGKPRGGVVVEGGGRSVTTDEQGLCALLDLPGDGASIALILRPTRDTSIAADVTAPKTGRHRKQVKLTVP